MAKSEQRSDEALTKRLDSLKKEFEALNRDRIRTEERLANLEENLTRLEAEAKERYGTADPAELEKLLQEKRADNERLVAEYESHIDSIKNGLDAIEQAADSGRAPDDAEDAG